MKKATFIAVVFLVAVLPSGRAGAQFFQESPAFRFNTTAFWLNLHNFLYVLGRAQSNATDVASTATISAKPDEARGLETMKPEDVAVWRRAVDHYATELSSLDPSSDESLMAMVLDLAASGDAPSLGPTTRIDAKTRAVLESAAPIFRRTYWPIHLSVNRRFEGGMLAYMKPHQRAVTALITRSYGVSWPQTGFEVHLSAYTNGAGAYGLRGPVIVMSSGAPDMRGSVAFETAVAEAMHQWDQRMAQRLERSAATKRLAVDEWLPQGLIYYTAGEAVRRAIPAHVPNATKFNLWAGHARVRQALDAAWRPWLDGRGYSDDAVASLVAATSAAPPPVPRATPRRKR